MPRIRIPEAKRGPKEVDRDSLHSSMPRQFKNSGQKFVGPQKYRNTFSSLVLNVCTNHFVHNVGRPIDNVDERLSVRGLTLTNRHGSFLDSCFCKKGMPTHKSEELFKPHKTRLYAMLISPQGRETNNFFL